VSDKQGLSYYADSTISGRLRMNERTVAEAREELITHDLIVYQPPLTQVLSLPPSRLCYIEFTLSQRKAEFYRAIRHALEFYGGSPRQIIFDNLKAAVLNGSGRNACLHPEFLALCGHYYLEPIACQRRDPESKDCVACYTSFMSLDTAFLNRRGSDNFRPWHLTGLSLPGGSYKNFRSPQS